MQTEWDFRADGPYAIYVFERNLSDQACSFWRRHSTMAEKKQALSAARLLFGSGDYCRVEVKRRHVDPRSGGQRDQTLKCWTQRRGWGIFTALWPG